MDFTPSNKRYQVPRLKLPVKQLSWKIVDVPENPNDFSRQHRDECKTSNNQFENEQVEKSVKMPPPPPFDSSPSFLYLGFTCQTSAASRDRVIHFCSAIRYPLSKYSNRILSERTLPEFSRRRNSAKIKK